MFAANLKEFNRDGITDKNGNLPIILNVLAGKCPSKRMISKGWADAQGMTLGKTYLINPVEVEANEYGRNFRFDMVQELGPLDIIKMSKEMPAEVYNVSSKVDPNQTEEKIVQEMNSKVKEKKAF